MSDELATEVRMGNARLGLFNRIVLDDVLVCDQNADTLLSAARLSAKMDVWQLMQGRVRIENIQLFGYDIRLRRTAPDVPYNFQFIIDRFASQDTTRTPLDLQAGSIIIRRGTLSHDLDYQPHSDRFTLAHVRLSGLGLQASIKALTDDSVSLAINELKCKESRSGFVLNNLQCRLDATHSHALLTDFNITLPHSFVSIPELRTEGPLSALTDLHVETYFQGHLTPSDLQAFVPQLSPLEMAVNLSGEAAKHDRHITVSQLTCNAEGMDIALNAHAQVNLQDSTVAPPFDEIVLHLQRGDVQQPFVRQVLGALSTSTALSDSTAQHPSSALVSPEIVKKVYLLGDISITGEVTGSARPRCVQTDLQVATSIGKALLRGSLTDSHAFELHAETQDFRLATLLNTNPSSTTKDDFPVDHITLNADLQGSTKARTAKGKLVLTDLSVKGTNINRISADIDLRTNHLLADVTSDDDEYAMHLNVDLRDFDLEHIDLNTLETLQGQVTLDDVRIRSTLHNYDLHQLKVAMHNDADGHHLTARGDFINAHADGQFRFASLVPTVQHFMHRIAPSLIPDRKGGKTAHSPSLDQMTFSLHAWNANPIFNLLDFDIQLPEAAYVNGSIDAQAESLMLNVDLPRIIYGAEDLRSVCIMARQKNDSINAQLSVQRMMEDGPVELTASAEGGNDLIQSMIGWDNHQSPAQRGALNAFARFFRDEQHQLGAEVDLRQGQLVISDTIWNLQASKLMLHNGVVDVENFGLSQFDRHLRVDGRVSKDVGDTLYADLQGMKIEYILGLIDFHDVEMAGAATGRIKIHDIFKSVAVDADLTVKDFTLNDGLLGTVYVTGGFGRKDDRAIDLNALIQEPDHHDISHVVGLIKPGHEEGRGLQLDIQARHLNIYFINAFTEGIFNNMQGCASGHAYLHGPFKRLDLEGDLVVDTLSTGINVLGTHYHLLGGDSLHFHPGGIRFPNVQIYDDYHVQGSYQHRAELSGELRYRHFKDIEYDFDIKAHNLLGYDFRDFGDESFYGTVFADGTVTLSGQPGALNVDLRCRPTNGTVFTYNVSTPETLTDNKFITFVSATPNAAEHTAQTTHPAPTERTSTTDSGDEDSESNDIHVNFDLDITPDAQMRLLMDPRSEDYITLYGNGHIRASFYNKGRFQMYGAYRVDHGTYRLSLQDVIRKEFHFQPGGTIVFGGQPLKAALNLQAIYTVPSVSLNDLAAGSNFSNASVRVNCLMNLSGLAERPQVSFDFDIPNVNEDEKQMVRSLISTEEERNLQIIYLLGIGRFYTYGLESDESQASAAVQSLLSSTLSGQLNQFLSNAIGNGNWNFGTNLSTGTLGWQDMDVEGSLSGRLLNNRLLINGTFGYRDTPIANTNFIGDFDVQWLLTSSGNLSLKAYSETNDRYFTKTALTTQGIGIKVKKDFNTLRELFLRKRP